MCRNLIKLDECIRSKKHLFAVKSFLVDPFSDIYGFDPKLKHSILPQNNLTRKRNHLEKNRSHLQ